MRRVFVKTSCYTTLVLLLSGALLTGCIITAEPDYTDNIQGSGLLETQTIDVIDFSRVSMAIPGEMIVTQGLEESLILSAQTNLFPYIKIFVDEDRLHIETQDDIEIEPTRPISIQLTVKSLKDLVFAGHGMIRIDSLATTNMSVTLAGSGDIAINQLTSIFLEATLAGSGDMLFSGVVDEQKVVLAGSGDIQARDLESKIAEIEIAGSGSAVVNVSDELRALIVGSGSIRYLGDPTVVTTIVGSGTVSPLGE